MTTRGGDTVNLYVMLARLDGLERRAQRIRSADVVQRAALHDLRERIAECFFLLDDLQAQTDAPPDRDVLP